MTAVSREEGATRAEYLIDRLADPAQIRRILEPEETYAAYALAHLDPALFGRNEWILSQGPAGRQALLVHSRGGLGNALFAIGDPAALDAAMSLHPGARFSFASLRIEHRPIVEKYYVLTRPQLMERMSVTASNFQACSGPAVRLTGADAAVVNRLYSLEGGPTAYQPSHLEEAVYYGVFQGGSLVSVTGTHVVSRSEGIAVVGNVFTHPAHRGRGLATYATSAVTEELLGFCHLVALTVEALNEPALRIYTRLGYKTACNLHETPVIRKEPLGVLSATRRLLATWRGRREGKEVVLR